MSAIASYSGLLAAVVAAATVLNRPAFGQASAPAGPALSDLNVEQWLADLDFLSSELPKRHKDAFHAVSAEAFELLTIQTSERLRACAPYERPILLATLVAKLGDSHTMLDWRPMTRGFHLLPLAFGVLTDGVIVAGTTAEHQALADAELLKIDGMTMGEVVERVGMTFSHDNESWKLYRVREYLSVAEVLKATGVTKAVDRATLTVRLSDGRESDVELAAVPAAERPAITFAAHDPVGPAKWSIAPREDLASYWFELLPHTECLYVRYDRCADDPQKPVAKFTEELLARLQEDDWERVVFDLRRNTGGNSALLDPLIAKLRDMPRLRERGRCVLLIGRATYSSGLMNAWRLREATDAVCIGLPTGQGPNHFGEVRSFELPNSKLKVYYSTKRFELDPHNRPALMPDVEVGTTLADFRAGRDPALERAIEWKP